MKGLVVSTKQKNTATVLVTGSKTHPLYRKTFVSSKKYLAQDDLGVAVGQIVEIVPIKPISKRKVWKITKVLGRDIESIVSEELKEAAEDVIEEVLPIEKANEVEKEIVDVEKEVVKKGGRTKLSKK